MGDKANGNNSDTVDFENYRHVCHKWHYKIAKALVVCLESKNFVPIRNSLIVLTKIIQHFPAIQNLATVIEKRVEKVCEEEKEKRQDLYIKARSYQGQLVSRKSKMMKEGDFHVVKGKKEETSAAESPTKEKAKEKEKNGAKESPPKLDRLEKKEKAKREKERKEKEGKEEKETSSKKEKKRDRDSEGNEGAIKKRREGEEREEKGSSGHRNGEDRKKSSSRR